MVPEIVDSILKENCPAFLHSIRLTKFNLGSEAPRLESVECFDNLEPDEMQMIWHASFVPVTREEDKYDDDKRKTEIQATAFVGNDKFQVPLNVNVSNLLFEGKLLLRVRFTHSYPYIKTASVCFMEPPKVSCALKPLVGIDLMSVPGVQQVTDITIKTVLKEVAMNPTTIDIDLENMLKATSHDDPIGLLKVNIIEGRGLKNIEKLGTSDPYLKMNLGGNEIIRTKVIDNDLNPYWNETRNLIIPLNAIRDSFIGADNISFEVFDKNKTADKLMGRSDIFRLSEFAKLIDELEEEALNPDGEEKKEEAKPTTPVTRSKKPLTPEDRERIIKQWGDPRNGEVLQVPLKLEGKDAGSLNIQISYHPISKQGTTPAAAPAEQPKPQENEGENDKAREVEAPEQTPEVVEEELRSGILRVHLYSMKDLEKRKGVRSNPYALVEVNHEKVMETDVKKKTNNPVFSLTEDIYVRNIDTASLTLTVKDKQSLGSDTLLGNLRFKIKPTMKYLLENPTNDWLELQNSPKGRVRFGFDWFPIKMNEETGGDNNPAIGICRVDLLNANKIKNADTLGKSDPYSKITISGRKVGQSRVLNSNLNPIWNETYYTIVQSRNDRIKIEILDFNNINNDKKLGSVEYFIKDICDNVSEETGPSTEFEKMRVKPVIQKLQDGRYDITSPLYEKQQKNVNCEGEVHFQLQYYPLTVGKPKDTDSAATSPTTSPTTEGATEGATEATTEKATPGAEVDKRKQKIAGSSRGFSIFSSSQMGISSIDLNDPNKNNITGILRIKLEEAKNLREGSCAYTEFSFDNSPDEIFYRSAVIKSSTPVWDEISEGLIMNIIHNKLLLNVRVRSKESGPSDADTSLLALKFGLNDIATNLNKSVWYTDDKTNPEAPAVKISFGYAPIDIVVPPKDYLPNMGVLTVNVDDGKVIAVDSSGTSDPFIIFNLNGNKVYTTKEIKKTLEPCWNEKFDINIRSRKCAQLELQLMDWNKVEKSTLIGTGVLSLVGLVPDQNLAVPVEIMSKEDKMVGKINLVLNFHPQSVSTSKQDREKSSENSSAPAKVINNVAEGGFKVVKGVFKAPSSVVSGVASGFTKTFKGNKNKGSELKDESPTSVTSANQQQQINTDTNASFQQENSVTLDKTNASEMDNTSVVSGGETTEISDENLGTLYVHVLEAKDLPSADSSGTSDPYVKVMKGKKEIGKTKVVKKNNTNPQWNETFKVGLDEVLNQPITIIIKDHNSFSSKTLGELQINNHNSFPTNENAAAEEWFQIPSTNGSIHLKLEYNAEEKVKRSKKK